jgi:3'-phosphoadenosine 5'-phosphosulfate sulfotransferase (PAPS reductase)/FAD synthetase
MMRAFSYGGGVQSTAALVLAAQGRIDFPLFLFANVGDDSENPATLRFVTDVATPYAAAHGIELVELRKSETLRERVMRSERSVPIPVRMSGSGAFGTRQCTQRFKIAPIAAELKRRGATISDPATVGLGISLDEFHRARSGSPVKHETIVYPLLDLRLDRQDCQNLITRAGLPTPPKSSCYFCPFQTPRQWQTLRANDPESFARSVEMESVINTHRRAMDRDPVWLSGALRPLAEAITDDGQLSLFEGGCDIAGYCHA